MSQVAVTLVKESLVQLGVALTDVTLLYDWGKKVGNFLRAADNDEDLVEVLSEPPEVLLPRSSLIDLNTMRARWPAVSFTYGGNNVTSSGRLMSVDEEEKQLTKFGWLMVAVVTGLDLCLSRDRVFRILVAVLAAVLGREGEVEESLRITISKNLESWRQVGHVRELSRQLERVYIKERWDKVGTNIIPQLNEAEEKEMQRFLVWLMKEKENNHFRAIPIDVYALAAGLKAVGVFLKLDGPRKSENETIVEYCSESTSSDATLIPWNSAPSSTPRVAQVSYPLRKPKAMIESIPASRQVLNRMGFLWDLGSQAAENLRLVAQSETPFENRSEIWYSVDGDNNFDAQRADTKTQILAGRAFPMVQSQDSDKVLAAVETLLESKNDDTYHWLHQHTDLNYLQRTATTSGNQQEMEAMFHFQALVFGFYFKLLEPLVCFDRVESSIYCQGLWGTGSNMFLAMCVEFASILRRERKISRAHVLFMLSSMYNGRKKALHPNDATWTSWNLRIDILPDHATRPGR